MLNSNQDEIRAAWFITECKVCRGKVEKVDECGSVTIKECTACGQKHHCQ